MGEAEGFKLVYCESSGFYCFFIRLDVLESARHIASPPLQDTRLSPASLFRAPSGLSQSQASLLALPHNTVAPWVRVV